MTLKYFPTEKILVNPDTGKRLAAFEVDGTQYISVYGIILLLGVYRGYAAQFLVNYLHLCYKVQLGVGRPVYCVKVKDWTRVAAYVSDQQARKGITVMPCLAGDNQ